MDNDKINERYLAWLIDLVDSDRVYERLLSFLHNVEFSDRTAKLIPNDINRIDDGRYLREKFCFRYQRSSNKQLCCSFYENLFPDYGCSILELLIGLAYRIDDNFGIKSYRDWFWDMMANLDLVDNGMSVRVMDDICRRFLSRNYDRTGEGGLFPLKYPDRDQRNIEIWYQLNAYLNENYM